MAPNTSSGSITLSKQEDRLRQKIAATMSVYIFISTPCLRLLTLSAPQNRVLYRKSVFIHDVKDQSFTGLHAWGHRRTLGRMLKKDVSKAAASEEARRTLRYVEPLSDA